MTLYELLNKFSIEELWYILHNRHDLSGKPIKAERIFNLYKSAREELLALHAESNYTDNVLVCDFSIENDDSGAPDSWIHCNMLSPDEISDDKMQQYAIDFVPWNELIDCKVSDDSLAKLGALVCTAELLWEITFYGYSKSKVDDESKELQRLVEDIDSGKVETHQINPNGWNISEKETVMEEKAIAEWLANAPEQVKNIIFGFYAADVCGQNEDVDDITVDETLKRLKSVLDESGVKCVCKEDYLGLLRSMIKELDVDNQYLLLLKMVVNADKGCVR